MTATILILDDDPHFRGPIADELGERGHRVLEAARAKDASQVLVREQVDLIVVDGLLPDTDGVRWIESLRKRGDNTPITFVTGFWRDGQTYERLTKELGVALVAYKPVMPVHFSEQIEAILAESGTLDRLSATRSEGRVALMDAVQALGQAVHRARAKRKAPGPILRAKERVRAIRQRADVEGVRELTELTDAVENALAKVQHGANASAWRGLDAALKALQREAARALGIQAEGAQRLRRPKILIAHSNPRVRAQLAAAAREKLIAVVEAVDGPSAIAQLEALRPNAIAVELALPGEEGALEVVELARSNAGGDALGVAAVAANRHAGTRLVAAGIHAELFLAAPFDDAALSVSLGALTEAAAASRQGRAVVVDDPALDALCRALAHQLHITRVRSNANALFGALASTRPDVVLLTDAVEGASVGALCRSFRASPEWQEVPVLIFSAEPSNAEALPVAVSRENLAAPMEARIRRVLAAAEVGQELGRVGGIDPLTALPLRGPFLDHMAARISECRRRGRAMAICLVDVDGLNRINDTQGELAGDWVLTGLARAVTRRFRREDLRCRWAEDLIAVAFPGEEAETMLPAVTQLVDEFASMAFPGGDGAIFQASFSAGLASMPEDGATAEEVFEAAARRLVHSKRQGGSRVTARG